MNGHIHLYHGGGEGPDGDVWLEDMNELRAVLRETSLEAGRRGHHEPA